ncbi:MULTISPECIES: hypothetical protein [Streptomyces]|uniref:hypothetical protein n=1 Tax=Streptomyces TaxID=1883 RepID=UPI0036B27DC0
MSDKPYEPLHAPELEGSIGGPRLDAALCLARASLAQHATANVYDDRAMLRAAIQLEARLRDLVAALDQQAGRDPLAGIDPNLLDWHQGALAGDSVVCAFPQPGRPDYPCIWNRAYHPEHRDVLGNTWPARGGDDR